MGVGLPVETEGKGKGVGRVGGGWEQAKEPASQCARVCRNYALANYPLVSPRIPKLQRCDFSLGEFFAYS